MEIRKKTIVITSFILLILAFLILLSRNSNNKKGYYNISVILRNKNSEDAEIVKAGMEQAAIEENANLNYITIIKDNDIENQKEIIQKEVDKGIDALVIAPADYEKLTSYIEEVNKKVPIILFESNVNTKENIKYISSDNYNLGKELAEEVIRNGNTRNKIEIVKSKLNSSSVNEMIEGFYDEIIKSNKLVEIIELSEDEKDIAKEIENIFSKEEGNVIVAFEPNILASIGKHKKYYIDIKEKEHEIYGVGSSRLIISLIEEEIINGIAMQNEFNLGYITIKTLIGQIEKEEVNYGTIDSTIINAENMYSKENQRRLFPIIR